LGVIGKDVGVEEAHKILTNIVPKDLIYDFHLGIIEHGRKTCKAQTPQCGVCVVYGLCRFEKKTVIATARRSRSRKQSKNEIASPATCHTMGGIAMTKRAR